MQKFNEKSVSTWQNNSIWLRGFFMLVFGFIAGFARFAITLIAILQFLSLLIRRKPHSGLKLFGQTLNNYLYQINQFLTANSEDYPFPLGTWPGSR
jgi:type III secretory pathway component EscV